MLISHEELLPSCRKASWLSAHACRPSPLPKLVRNEDLKNFYALNQLPSLQQFVTFTDSLCLLDEPHIANPLWIHYLEADVLCALREWEQEAFTLFKGERLWVTFPFLFRALSEFIRTIVERGCISHLRLLSCTFPSRVCGLYPLLHVASSISP